MVFGRKILVELFDEQNRFNRVEMVAILNIKRTIRLERHITFLNQSHQTKSGKDCTVSTPIITRWQVIKGS